MFQKTRIGIYIVSILLICLRGWMVSHAQNTTDRSGLVFYQLNTSHGLSDNYINDMAIDSSGNLWVGTGDGLNMFNGKTVVKYFKNEYPEIPHDDIRQLMCDTANRIWLLTYTRNVAIIDEERRFHRLSLWDSTGRIPVRRMLDPHEAGMILFVRGHHYSLKDGIDFTKIDSLTLEHLDQLHVEGFDSLHQVGFRQVEKFDGRRYLYVLQDRFYVVDYVARKVVREHAVPDLFELCRWDRDRVLVRDLNTQRLSVIDLIDGEQTYPFDELRDQHGRTITDAVTNAEWVRHDELLLTTRRSGIYVYHSGSHTLSGYRHHAADPGTLINNSPTVIAADKTGWVFLGATPNGISYFKTDAVVGEKSVFIDATGNSYGGAIASIATLDNDAYYLAAGENLIKWKRSTNHTQFIKLQGITSTDPAGPVIFYVAFDQQRRLWVSTQRDGVLIFDETDKPVRQIFIEPEKADIPENRVRLMKVGPDGKMWCGTDRGLCRIDTRSFEIDELQETALDSLTNTYIHNIVFPDDDHVWISTAGRGAWFYTISTGQVEVRDTSNGLISDHVFCMNRDRNQNIYVGTNVGLQILFPGGGSKSYDVSTGLLHRRVEAMLLDKGNRMWMGNDVGLACFHIADTTLKAFDERYGLSVHGFRLVAYHQNSDDELIWGTEKGIQFFYPEELWSQKISFSTTIHRVETRDVVRNLTKSAELHLSPANNYVTFHFGSIDYSKHLRTFYAYQLEGLDHDWVKVTDQTSVRYSAIPPGTYTFRVRASNDDRAWVEAENAVTLTIATPLWQQGWFRMLGVAGFLALLWVTVRYYRGKQVRRHEELETQVVINYFASRINSYRKTEELLWDVAANCISQLHFEDCVIYLLDPVRNTLVQKAAYGPKADKAHADGRMDFSIREPIEIPVGQGIVGSVAVTGEALLISDTSLDDRYIVDDERRFSELAVPIKIDDRVIGVIDSEHSRRHFFTRRHLNILSTIAVLCANQIQRVRAEEEKQQAMIEVLKNQQKVTESRLQSLRLQMNPHFLFNALNSIQQMILANEEMVATRYLSRFSKLLRAILIHSDKEMVTLKEELEILNLYVDLESVRFKESFRYEIVCEEEIDIDEVRIPTLLIQPFVENAIWHGLMHKEGDRLLSVRFFESDDWLHCIVRDNGIGREKAREMRISGGKNHTSKGIAVSLERVKSMQGVNGSEGSIVIRDLRNGSNEPAGTEVEISLPLQ